MLNRKVADNLRLLREKKPLVHNITNFVVMNFTANVLLAIGASPIMAHAREEMEDMAALADALSLNIGTISPCWIRAMLLAGKCASERGRPLVLDPVGVGATTLRANTIRRILEETKVTVLRGNASEILFLANKASANSSLDAQHSVDEAAESAIVLARHLKLTVAMSGETDLVTDGSRCLRITGGHALMPLVTGTGCALSSLVAAFLAVEGSTPPDPLLAAASALACFSRAGELAAEKAQGPGTFIPHFLDALHIIQPEDLALHSRISEL